MAVFGGDPGKTPFEEEGRGTAPFEEEGLGTAPFEEGRGMLSEVIACSPLVLSEKNCSPLASSEKISFVMDFFSN